MNHLDTATRKNIDVLGDEDLTKVVGGWRGSRHHGGMRRYGGGQKSGGGGMQKRNFGGGGGGGGGGGNVTFNITNNVTIVIQNLSQDDA